MPADAAIATEVEHAQQVRLQHRRHFGDLVEEQRAVRRLFEEAQVSRERAGEAAFLVAEQLARKEFARDRAAVHRDERPRATARFVDRARDEFLADAAFAVHEHGRVGRCDFLDHPAHRLESARCTDHAVVRRRRDRRCDASVGGGGMQQFAQAIGTDGFDQVVDDRTAQRMQRRLDRRPAGDDHRVRALRVDIVEQAQPAAVGQVQIDEREIVIVLAHAMQRLAEFARDGDFESLQSRDFRRRVHEADIVVDDEQRRRGDRGRGRSSSSRTTGRHPCRARRGDALRFTPQ